MGPHLLTEAGEAVVDATERLELLADTATDGDYERAIGAWFGAIRTFGEELQRVTGLSASDLAERLVP